MTAIEKIEAIKDLLETELPTLLTGAGLDDFDQYRTSAPTKVDDKELCTYIVGEYNDESSRRFIILIQVQIYGADLSNEYHSVIFPFLEKNLTGAVVGMEQKTELDSDVWPIDMDSSTSFAFYQVSFQDNLDDCG